MEIMIKMICKFAFKNSICYLYAISEISGSEDEEAVPKFSQYAANTSAAMNTASNAQGHEEQRRVGKLTETMNRVKVQGCKIFCMLERNALTY